MNVCFLLTMLTCLSFVFRLMNLNCMTQLKSKGLKNQLTYERFDKFLSSSVLKFFRGCSTANLSELFGFLRNSSLVAV